MPTDTRDQVQRLLDDVFVQQPDDRARVRLSDRWGPSPVGRAVRRQPRERRETLLAAGFAIAALLLGPVGMYAVATGRAGSFLLVTALLVLVVAVPRPWAGPRDADGARLRRPAGPTDEDHRERERAGHAQ